MARRVLLDITDRELREMIRSEATAEHLQYSYDDILAELNRRAAERQARDSRILSLVSLGIALFALVVSALRP